MIYTVFVIFTIIAAGAVLVWNFYPPAREYMRGLTTLADALLGGVWFAFNLVVQVITEAKGAGAIPAEWMQYVPFILLAWMVYKRLVTKTPVADRF
jgi:hypothetical protein